MSENVSDTTEAVEAEAKSTTDRIGPMHEAFAAYVNDHTDQEVTAEQVFAVISNRVRFRQSETYKNDVKAAKEAERLAKVEAKAEAARLRREASEAKAKEREEAKAKKAEEAAAKKTEREAAAAAKAAEKAAKAEAKASETPADGEEAKPAKGKRSGKKSASEDQDKASDAPF